MVSTSVGLKVCTVLYPVRIGKSRVFDRSQTKYMHCIVPRESRGVEGFLEVFYKIYGLYCTL